MKHANFSRIMMFLFAFYFLGNFSGIGAQSANTDWSNWGGPNGNFIVNNAGILQAGELYALKVVWRKPLGAGYSPISVLGDLAVTMFSDETLDYVIGLNAQDGSERWKYKIGPAYLGHYGSQSGPLSTPILTEDKVFALGPRGRLFALDVHTGKELWTVDLVADHQAIAPFWGFTSSPIMHDNRLIVQTGGANGNAVSAFNPGSGDLIWSAVGDSVNYQSPGMFKFGGQDHLVFLGNTYLSGLSPETGHVLWQFAHGGQTSAGNTSGHPVEVGEGRYFVKNGGMLVSVRADNEIYAVEEVWRSRHIRSTYLYSVVNDGHLFGYNGQILTCVDVNNGERVWRSREPGDGLPIVIDEHLVIITKDGKMAISQASGEGYNESGRLDLFDDIVWAPASFANGKLYARSMSEIACVEIVPRTEVDASADPLAGIVPGSRFARFVEQVNGAADKKALIDAFIADQKFFPIIEGDDLAHFVYRGEADEVSMTGDHVGRRFDQPLHRIDGTDFFYYSFRLEPDARITYRYTLNLQQRKHDPLNLKNFPSLYFNRASWFAMPKWKAPYHLEARENGVHGRVDSVLFESESINGSKKLEVYLPAGYDGSHERYPVAYVHASRRIWSLGKVDVSLDNVIGKSVRPVILVVVPSLVGGGYSEYVGSKRDDYDQIFTNEVVPFIDRTYRTIANRESRANMGTIYGAFMAFYATFKHPEVFSKLAIQSISWDQMSDADHADMLVPPSTLPAMQIYLDWGKYDMRSPMEGNDIGKSSESFAERLKSKGYSFVGGEVNDGAGWASWRNRTDKVFETLFPLKN